MEVNISIKISEDRIILLSAEEFTTLYVKMKEMMGEEGSYHYHYHTTEDSPIWAEK